MLTFDRLHHTYHGPGGAHTALRDISFTVNPGEFACLVGPSGCGKTTLLRAVAGLLRPSSGNIALDGEPVIGVPEGLGLVCQDYSRSLLPWRTALGNVTFGLGSQHLLRTERRRRAHDALAAVGLTAAARQHPWQLSGGMQQRVAIARALACRPRLLLADEPFASVDAQTRADLEDLLLNLRRRYGMTILLVTHDIDEAVYLADRVLVLGHPTAGVLADLAVDLPPERDQIATRQHETFIRRRTEIARLVRAPDTTTTRPAAKTTSMPANANADAAEPAAAANPSTASPQRA